MDIVEINIILDALKEKRKAPLEELSKIDRIIAEYELKLENEKRKSQNIANSVLVLDLPKVNMGGTFNGAFPINSNIKTQILHVFDIEKRPLKMTEISDSLKKHTGKNYNIKEFVRNMSKNKQVILMKINNSNRLSYWVKPEWLDKESNTLRDGYKLDNMDLLYNTSQISFL